MIIFLSAFANISAWDLTSCFSKYCTWIHTFTSLRWRCCWVHVFFNAELKIPYEQSLILFSFLNTVLVFLKLHSNYRGAPYQQAEKNVMKKHLCNQLVSSYQLVGCWFFYPLRFCCIFWTRRLRNWTYCSLNLCYLIFPFNS